MKNKLLILIAALAVTVTAAGCNQKDNTANKTDNASKQEQTVDVSDNYAEGASKNVDMDKINGTELDDEDDENDSVTLTESAVSIEDAVLTTADGRNIIIVSYRFTNKSNNDESFNSIMKSDAYQDGLSVSHAVVHEDIEGFDPNSTAERIAPGKTIVVQEAYLPVSDATPIEVVVQEFHSESGVSARKTFNLQ